MMTHSHGPVPGHSNRKLRDLRIYGLKFQKQPLNTFKVLFHHLHIIRICCHSHKSADTDSFLWRGYWFANRRFATPPTVFASGPLPLIRPRVARGFRTNTLSTNCPYLICGKTLFGFFGAKVEFQEDIHNAVVGYAPGVDGFQKMKRVNGLDQSHIGQDKFEFIGLEMADKMPLDIWRHEWNLGGEFLGAALGKDALTGVIRFHEAGNRMEL